MKRTLETDLLIHLLDGYLWRGLWLTKDVARELMMHPIGATIARVACAKNLGTIWRLVAEDAKVHVFSRL